IESRESGVRCRVSGVRCRESEVRSPQSTIENRKSKIESQESGFRSQESEVRSPQSTIDNRKSKIEIPPRSRGPARGNWALAVLLGLLSIPFVSGEAHGATIKGTVYDPGGLAVPNVRVSLLRLLTALDERQTNAKGEYQFEGLTRGTYRLVANAPGFSASTADVETGEDQARIVDLHLALSAVQQQVVVSASLEGALAPQLGSSVSTVSEQEIDDRGAQSVTDVLRGVPGVAWDDTGRRGGATGAFIRGGDTDYNLVMVDGIQMNEFGGYFDFSPLPADGVDHVEVTRGPESALFGSNAVTGVVNIVTRRGEGPPHFDFQAEGGNFTTRRFVTGGSGLTHGLSWAYDLSRLDSGGTVTNDSHRNQSA